MIQPRLRTANTSSFTGKLLYALVVSLLLCASCKSGAMTPVERQTEATKLAKAGREDFRRGDIDAAIAKFEKALQLSPGWIHVMKDYAELLYIKGLSYGQRSNKLWGRALGKEFDEVTRAWKPLGDIVPEEEKGKLQKESGESLKKALLYFRKSLDQYQALDRLLGSADENTIFNMAMVHICLDEFDEAVTCFERVLDSPRVDDKNKREKIREAIDIIREYQKQPSPLGQ